ncbi:spore maturation protein [Halothermothrix orenii]|uniref:Nucleoside recognition domain protein n=1 Tax=Halothermothrix orenii (strain H 168 / OCM 544 / DSM 9562) TaxID=373903 RepID=B8CXB5_HALOH|nr:nucleoside recognition domain-containing protein [Halothermothrix orenii]ACL69934.1 nucleoside recognition domain protein [Halothermothrix orenii H 168]
MELFFVVSIWAIPLFFVIILIYGYFKGINLYETFIEGAAEGFNTVVKITPYLLAMMVAINIFKESGALKIFINILKPFFSYLQIPEPVIPLLFLRPLSGSASLSYASQIMKQFGPDSFIGNLASTVQGSTETTFYILAVYFGAIGIKHYRYSIIVGLIADVAGFFAAIFICKHIFL